MNPSDQHILEGLRKRDNRAFAMLYTTYYSSVERFVLRNSGSAAEARDIFQETVLVLLEKVPASDFELTSTLKTYLLAISRNLWLKRLQQAGRLVQLAPEELEYATAPEETAAFSHDAESSVRSQVQRLLARISTKCQALIQALFFGRKTIQMVVQEHHYTTVHNAQNQKYKCLEQARRRANQPAAQAPPK